MSIIKEDKLDYDSEDYDYDDWDICYECQGYGDDYYINEDGELECACDDCPFNDFDSDPWDD